MTNGNMEPMVYNPIKTKGTPYVMKSGKPSDNWKGVPKQSITVNDSGDRFPRTVQFFNKDSNKLHPTQKPVEMMEYFIKTYTNEGDLVLDCCMGSGTTGVACVHTNRNFIGIELNKEYFDIAKRRIETENNTFKRKEILW